ncbi:hypothetical protein JCM10213_005481 [Rhodosporidiobolus nylandii]
MKLPALLASLALAGTLALSAALHPSDSTAVDLEKREPVPAPVAEGDSADKILDERGRSGRGGNSTSVEVSVKVKIKSGTPAYDYQPDNSGFGYGVDYNGQGPPSWCPHDWQWFGRCIGWAPYTGWRPDPRWSPPVFFIKIWVKVTWWTPPSDWRRYHYNRWQPSWYRWPIPFHWGWLPKPLHRGGYWKRQGNEYRYYDRKGSKWWKRDDATVDEA